MRDDKEALFERFFAMVDNTITRIADESMTNDDKALMERLRRKKANGVPTSPFQNQAANRICELSTQNAAQAAEIERLREAINDAIAMACFYYDDPDGPLRIKLDAALGETE